MNNIASIGIDYSFVNKVSYWVFELRSDTGGDALRCTYINPMGQQIFPALSTTGEQDMVSVFPAEVVQAIREMLQGGEVAQQKIMAPVGQHWLTFCLLPANHQIIVMAYDVTDIKMAEAERERIIARLQESNRELEKFAWKASHELREPTRKIVAFGERLAAKYGPVLVGDGQLYLTRMQQAALRMQTKIDALLEFARVSRADTDFEPVNLTDILAVVLNNLEVAVEDSQVQIECDNLPAIEAHPSQVEQLFQNLLANAIKFHQPGEQPRVEIRCAGGLTQNLPDGLSPGRKYLRLEFHDHGVGFEQENADRIFQLLERLHGRSEYEGSGIGLAICKKIVENHNGCIYAESVPGQGSTFYVWLPETQEKPA